MFVCLVLVSLMGDSELPGISSIASMRKIESWSKLHSNEPTEVNCFRVRYLKQKFRANKETRSRYSWVSQVRINNYRLPRNIKGTTTRFHLRLLVNLLGYLTCRIY